VLVVLADPAAFLPPPSLSPQSAFSSVDDRTIAFPAVHRYEFV
jgi:hypothetical protein